MTFSDLRQNLRQMRNPICEEMWLYVYKVMHILVLIAQSLGFFYIYTILL